jgi:hypothetical protein
LNANYSQTTIQEFVKAYVESKKGTLTQQPNALFTIQLPNEENPTTYTYDASAARGENVRLVTPGSPAFQQMLRECLKNGFLCHVALNPRGSFEELIKKQFKDTPFACENCERATVQAGEITLCERTHPCFHQINNCKIVSVTVGKREPLRYFLFYFSVTFQNRLRAKSDEPLTILLDEEGKVVEQGDFSAEDIFENEVIQIQDVRSKVKSFVFEDLKKAADEKLVALLEDKLVLFDLPLEKEKKIKMQSFEKRLRRERRERVISKKLDFDYLTWQANYEALLKREEESFTTHISVKFSNLLVIETARIKFELHLDNKSAIASHFILGVTQPEVTCSLCRKTIFEGYATQDALYVCKDCVRQSIDTGKVYSKKAPLRLDEALQEYIEADSGFVCTVCGKRHSRLLEFKCSHDNSSVCIYHYELCDMCGKVFSTLNLKHSGEFKRQLCPKHATKEKLQGA